MNTDKRPDLLRGEETKLLLKSETEKILSQMLNYLRITKLRVGLILNFKHSHLEWERVVL